MHLKIYKNEVYIKETENSYAYFSRHKRVLSGSNFFYDLKLFFLKPPFTANKPTSSEKTLHPVPTGKKCPTPGQKAPTTTNKKPSANPPPNKSNS